MLSFVVFDNQALAIDRPLRHPSIIGTDNAPVAGEVHFESGQIHVVKSSAGAAGLSTQVDLDAPTLAEFYSQATEPPDHPRLVPLGTLTLQTCLLPERTVPYLLSLELARHRIMLILTKLELWQLFDLPPEHEVMRYFEAARLAFTEALVAQRNEPHPQAGGYGVRAHHLALRSLWLAIEASERLTLLKARRDFAPRVDGSMFDKAYVRVHGGPPEKGRPILSVPNPMGTGQVLPVRPAIGCVISPRYFSEREQRGVLDSCDFISMPMRWIDMEPQEGTYSFGPTDRWIEWAVRTAKRPVVAGPLIDFRPRCVPEWLYIWENDYETLRELVYEHIKALVVRYRRTVTRWTVASGIHVNASFKLTFDQMMDLTRIAVYVVRKLHPQARVQIEIDQPWGEYYTHNRKALPPLLYAEMLAQAGVQFDTLGLRVQPGRPRVGQSTRDLCALAAMLDRYAQLDRPIALTAVGVPSRPLDTPAGEPQHTPGWWRRGWSEQAQADWLTGALSIAVARPYIESVCWHDLRDSLRSPETPTGGLIDAAGATRSTLDRLVQLRKAVSSGTLPAQLAEDAAMLQQGQTVQ